MIDFDFLRANKGVLQEAVQDMIDTAKDQAGDDEGSFFWFFLGELENAFSVQGPRSKDFK